MQTPTKTSGTDGPSVERVFHTAILHSWEKLALPQYRTGLSSTGHVTCAAQPEFLIVVSLREEDFSVFTDSRKVSTHPPFLWKHQDGEGKDSIRVSTFPSHTSETLSLNPPYANEYEQEDCAHFQVKRDLYAMERTTPQKKVTLTPIGTLDCSFVSSEFVLYSFYFQRWCAPQDFSMNMREKVWDETAKKRVYRYENSPDAEANLVNSSVFDALHKKYDLDRYKNECWAYFSKQYPLNEDQPASDAMFEEHTPVSRREAFCAWLTATQQSGFKYQTEFFFHPLEANQYSTVYTDQVAQEQWRRLDVQELLMELDRMHVRERREKYTSSATQRQEEREDVEEEMVVPQDEPALDHALVGCGKQLLCLKYNALQQARTLHTVESPPSNVTPHPVTSASHYVSQHIKSSLCAPLSFTGAQCLQLCKPPSLILGSLLHQEVQPMVPAAADVGETLLEDAELCDVMDGGGDTAVSAALSLKEKQMTQKSPGAWRLFQNMRREKVTRTSDWPEEYFHRLPANGVGKEIVLAFAECFDRIKSETQDPAGDASDKEETAPSVEREGQESPSMERVDCVLVEEGVAPVVEKEEDTISKPEEIRHPTETQPPPNEATSLREKVRDILFSLLPRYQSDIRHLSHLVHQFSPYRTEETTTPLAAENISPVALSFISQFWEHMAKEVSRQLNEENDEKEEEESDQDSEHDDSEVASPESPPSSQTQDEIPNQDGSEIATVEESSQAATRVSTCVAAATATTQDDSDTTKRLKEVEASPAAADSAVTSTLVLSVYLEYYHKIHKTKSGKRSRTGTVLTENGDKRGLSNYPWLQHVNFLLAHGITDKEQISQLADTRSDMYDKLYRSADLTPPSVNRKGTGENDIPTLSKAEVQHKRCVVLLEGATAQYHTWLNHLLTAKQVYYNRWRRATKATTE
ncbi:hypothetical protein AGDE_16550 [Angomonas deanei]|nr:hypothetical protein AGDE_16550 [Angomonas deanei]|eukprot:EPY16903.1 hypothetical protein AGDE_16550 [Angomonas deanei]